MLIRFHITLADVKKRYRNASIELPEGATIERALAEYAERYRVSFDSSNMRGIIILRNNTVAWYGDALEDGDEITLLRVFAGG